MFTLDTPVAVNGYHEFGNSTAGGTPLSVNGQTLPAGTFYIPMAQGMKHWIQAVLGENPFIPYEYYYDVVTWSYPLQRGLSGSGFLTTPMSPGVGMTALPENANFGTVPTGTSAVYAFNTDSARGLDAGDRPARQGRQRLPRHGAASPPAGKQFYSGAALVDGASLAASGVSLAALAQKRNTPVTGLSSFPVPRKQLVKPKIGLYTGSATIPSNPLFITGPNVNGTTGHCAVSGGGGTFCEALHTLAVKNEIPLSTLIPVTSADITDGKLVSQGFTALINPNGSMATTTTTGTPPVHDAHADGGHEPAGVHQRRRQLRRRQRQRRQRRPHDRCDHAEHGGFERRPRACSRRARRSTARTTRPTRSPGASTSAAGSTVTRPATRCSTRGTLGNGTSVVTYAQHAGREVRLRDQRAALLTARPAVVDVPYGSGRSRPDRVQPVLPLLEGAGRAPRAQRGAVPEGRHDRRAGPVGGVG